MDTCWVFFPACSLYLWTKCFGYMLPNRSDNWSMLLMTDVATMKVSSFLSWVCSLTDGINFSKGISSGAEFWAVVVGDICTLSTTKTVLNRWIEIVWFSDVLKLRVENANFYVKNVYMYIYIYKNNKFYMYQSAKYSALRNIIRSTWTEH